MINKGRKTRGKGTKKTSVPLAINKEFNLAQEHKASLIVF